MSLGVKRSLPLLDLLKDSDQSVRSLISSNSKPELIDAISEICFNYLRGNINCSREQFKELSRHKSCLRKVVAGRLKTVNKTIDKNSKNKNVRQVERRILTQKGDGFWSALLAPLTSELTAYFISKAFKE